MKRYLLFSGYEYYPSGGWGDFIGDYNTVEEARNIYKKKTKNSYYVWYHIIDTHNMEEVEGN